MSTRRKIATFVGLVILLPVVGLVFALVLDLTPRDTFFAVALSVALTVPSGYREWRKLVRRMDEPTVRITIRKAGA